MRRLVCRFRSGPLPPLLLVAVGIAACLVLVQAHAVERDKSPPEREPSPACGNFDYRHIRMAAGPADYRVASESLILLVENAHFTPEVERLTRGKSSTIGADLAYTLGCSQPPEGAEGGCCLRAEARTGCRQGNGLLDSVLVRSCSRLSIQ